MPEPPGCPLAQTPVPERRLKTPAPPSALLEKTCFRLQAPWFDVRHVSQRNPEVRRQVRIDSEEPRRRHADNGKRSAVQVDRAAHGVALSAQFAHPVSVTHDRYI